jgi:OmpA-OmpF porin, OOP family
MEIPLRQHRSGRGAPVAAALLASLAAAAPAAAQTVGADGFAVNRFSPSDRGSDWFTLDSLDLRGHLRPALGILAELAYKPLIIYGVPLGGGEREERVRLIETQLHLHVGAALVLKDRLRVAASLPLVVHQSGTSGMLNGVSYTAPEGFALGDLRLSGTVRLLGVYGDVFTLAAGAQLSLPTGDRASYSGDGHVRANVHLAAAGDVGMVAYAGRLGIDYRALAESVDGSALGSEVFLAASVGIRALERRLLVGIEAFGATVFTEGESFFARRTSPFEALLGAHYRAGDVRVGAGVGRGFTSAFGTPAARFLATFEWAPAYRAPGPPSDRDGDGILDRVDACPDVPGVPDPDPKKHGCPPERPDRDGDGVFDDEDACPDMPGVRDPDPEKNGCPPDRDGDGILDLEDACPDVPGVRDPDPAKHGCPPDRDGDTIVDADDACPDVPGPANEDPKKHGCPPIQIAKGQILILEQVKFKTNSDVILPESDEILTAVAQTLTDHPELLLVEVQGHTDSVGGVRFNQGLSERRARSVIRWLTTRGGIARQRLVGKGFGLTVPVDSNRTDEGRQNNRRVEFHIRKTAP